MTQGESNTVMKMLVTVMNRLRTVTMLLGFSSFFFLFLLVTLPLDPRYIIKLMAMIW